MSLHSLLRQILLTLRSSHFSIRYNQVRVQGNTYCIPAYARHRPAVRCFLDGVLYEPRTHDFVSYVMSQRGGSLVHAGAFFGDMLAAFSKSGASSVYAFEPVFENYLLARMTMMSNSLENVFLLNSGLGDEIGLKHMCTQDDAGRHAGGGSYVAEAGDPTPIITIDSLSPTELSLIQLDIEGHEYEALVGAAQSIRRDQPIIMIEDIPGRCDDLLEAYGYVFAGEIPGLKIWSTPGDMEFTSAALTHVLGSNS